MQSLPSVVPGTVVRVRRQRWRVVRTLAGSNVVLVTLAGTGGPNAGILRSFVSPFDRVDPVEAAPRARHVTTAAWRNVVRDLIASTAPGGSLRVLARARLDVLPHQLEPALAIVRGLATRVLLADDVGLGKTIEAGLILAELLERGAIRRALVLTPAGLREQWQAELRARFGIDAVVADASALATVAAAAGQPNPWLAFDVAIASIDLVKRREQLAALLQCAWDLLLVDEAHNAAGDSDRHEAVAALAGRTPYVVLATATPHNGDRAAFVSLCGIGGCGEACAMFRRARGDVRTASGRRARLVRVIPTTAERRMHAALAEFTRAVVAERVADRDATLGVAVLNKRALSSAGALLRSAATRLERLALLERGAVQPPLPFDDLDGELDDDETPTWSGRPALADPTREQRLLGAIAAAAADAVRDGESKLALLSRWLRRVGEPVIVFTEYRDTLARIGEAVGRPVLQLHGGLSAVERRAVLRAFPSAAGVLLATDAAGEGLNLHERCRIVVNLELPWNPVRIEQRIGRVDRIGQQRTVHALTLVAAGTAEEQILARLLGRIACARRDLDATDPFALFTEADARALVLGIAEAEVPAPIAPTAATFDLSAEAAKEADRIRLVRAVARVPGGVDGMRAGAVAGRLRHRSTRAAPAMVLAEASVEDGSGAILERCLVPLTVPRATADAAVIDLLERSGVVAAASAPALESARRFAATRAARERAIAAGATLARGSPLQIGLFDRRAERAIAAASAATSAALEALACRRAAAEAAASGTTLHVHVRVILRP